MAADPLTTHRDAPAVGRAHRPVASGGPASSTGAATRSPGRGWPLLVLLAFPVLTTAWGLPYYVLPLAQRLRHPLHPLLKSSGTVGLAFGVVAILLFLFMWLYPIRKHVRWLAWTGPVGRWLDVHIVMGLSLPVLAAVHAGWRFEGLIGLGTIAMVIVSLSGVVGRYLYTHIPRDRAGLELSREESAAERRRLLTELAVETGLTPQELERALGIDSRPAGPSILSTFRRLLTDDLHRWRTLRRLRSEWSRGPQAGALRDGARLGRALRLARRELALAQQVRLLDATRRVFGWWHVAHRPFALTALLAVLVHVVVAIWIGGVRLTLGSFPR